MNIHEYQAKELLEKFGVATTRGKVASTPDEAEAIARKLGKIDIVVKAQVHAGGRGKGTFKNGFKRANWRNSSASNIRKRKLRANCSMGFIGRSSGAIARWSK